MLDVIFFPFTFKYVFFTNLEIYETKICNLNFNLQIMYLSFENYCILQCTVVINCLKERKKEMAYSAELYLKSFAYSDELYLKI